MVQPALKYALHVLGFMRPDIRLPLVELTDAVKSEVENAILSIGEDLLRYLGRSPASKIHGFLPVAGIAIKRLRPLT
jgi:hypothetical protein